MKLNILCFGITKDIVGRQRVELELPEAVSVAVFKGILEEKYPQLDHLHAMRIAVNNTYASDDLIIQADDEVALIPPVSGG